MSKAQIDKLAMMANQIAQFFGSYPHDQAVAGVASHIEAFWTPRMRDILKNGAHARTDLDPLVREALGPDVEAQSPAAKAAASPGKVGELGAVDAG